MRFIEPKNRKLTNVHWKLPEKTVAIVKHYADYTGYTEEEVLAEFLENLLSDQGFIDHIRTKRNNKRMLRELEMNQDDI